MIIGALNHRVPSNDIKEHSFAVNDVMNIPIPQCTCGAHPALDPNTMGWEIIHEPFAGDDAIEWVNQIINYK